MNKQARTTIPRAAQGGFTLIELIVVIVILGILAATALPKFTDLSGDARAASLNAAGGALRSATAMAHGQSLVAGNAAKATSTIIVEGTTVNMVYGYPKATKADVAAIAGLNDTDYLISETGSGGTLPAFTAGSEVVIQPIKNPKATCYAKYTQAVDANTPAQVDLTHIDAADCL